MLRRSAHMAFVQYCGVVARVFPGAQSARLQRLPPVIFMRILSLQGCPIYSG